MLKKIETFAVVGGDMRSAYLAGELANEGYKVIASGFDSAELPSQVTGCSNINQAISLADCIVLPMPISTDNETLNAPFARNEIALNELFGWIKNTQKVLCGAVSYEIYNLANLYDVKLIDYLSREELTVLNAIPTAEGAIQLAMEELPITLHGARCLIAGYGRISKTLAPMLIGLGAEVVVAARSFADLAWARSNRCKTIHITELSEHTDYDVIFNTVPQCIFDRKVLKKIDRNTLIIDLASKPGGVDFKSAEALQIKTIWALSLPGRVAPKSAGSFIKAAILNILKEEKK